MTAKDSAEKQENPSENILCTQCGTPLPQSALYCGTCGRRVARPKKQRKKIRPNLDETSSPAQDEGAEETIRLAELPRRVREYYLSRTHHKASSDAKASQNNVSVLERETPVEEEARPLSSPSSSLEAEETRPPPSVASDISGLSTQGLPDADQVSVAQRVKTWRWLTILSLTTAAGILLIAAAFEAGRLGSSLADPLFWSGLVVIYAPIAARLFSAGPTRQERLALLIFLATALYLEKFLQYPLNFTYFDEFIHVRTAQDIITSGHLFHPNPILPLSPYFPGLEIAISALSSLTGLPIFASGTLLIGIIQLLTALSLYHLYKHLANSDRIAGIATVLYMANPGFLFDTAFAYESLALSLATFVLFVVALRCYAKSEQRRGLAPVIWLAIGAVVVTHHLTSYTLTGLLFLWTCVSLFLKGVRKFRRNRTWNNLMLSGPGEAGILALALCAAWLVFTQGKAIGYLAQYPVASVQELLKILSGHASVRQFFHSAAGAVIPRWEPVISYLSIAVILAGLSFSFFQIWRHHRANAVFLTLTAMALIYPVSLGFHLIPQGAEMAQRSTEFAFLGVGFLLAIGAVGYWMSRAKRWRHPVAIAGVVGVIFLGQMVTGNGQVWARLPGPYLVVADQRSIEPEGIDAAIWTGMYLAGHSVATDRVNMLLMSTYGEQWVPMAWNSNISVQSIFADPQFGPDVWAALQTDGVQYVVVDRRLSAGLPRVGTYFDIPWTDSNPIALSALEKFNGVLDVSRVFDSGNIVIYDVEPLTNPALNPLSLHTLCPPTPSNAATSAIPEARNYAGTLYDATTGITTPVLLTGSQRQSGATCGTFKVTPAHTPTAGIPLNGSFGAAITPGGQVQLILSGSSGTTTLNVKGQTAANGTIEGTFCSIEKAANSCSDFGALNLSPVK